MGNKKGCCLLLVLLTCCHLVYAKPVKDSIPVTGLKSLLQIKLSANFGIEWEKRITATSSLSLFGGWSIGRQTNDFTEKDVAIISSPDLFVEYRNYYNLLKRLAKHKITRNNAADFLFGRVENVFAVKRQNNYNMLLVEGWGIRRNISRKIVAGYHIGIAEHFYFDKPVTGGFNYIRLEPMSSFSISLVF